jgi:hypothetical protein
MYACDRAGEIAFAGGAVTDHYHFIKLLRIFGHGDVDHSLVADDNFLHYKSNE